MIKSLLAYLCVAIFLHSTSISAVQFVFKDKNNIPLFEETTINLTLFKNGKQQETPTVKTILYLNQTGKNKDFFKYSGKLFYLTSDYNKKGIFQKEKFSGKSSRQIRFMRNRQGKSIVIQGKSFIPRTSFPSFVKANLNPCSTWTGKSKECINLKTVGIEGLLEIPVMIKYTYTGQTWSQGKNLSIIKYSYSIFKKKIKKLPILLTLSAQIRGTIFWDNTKGMQHKANENFTFAFFFTGNRSLVVKGISNKKNYQQMPLSKN